MNNTNCLIINFGDHSLYSIHKLGFKLYRVHQTWYTVRNMQQFDMHDTSHNATVSQPQFSLTFEICLDIHFVVNQNIYKLENQILDNNKNLYLI